MTQQNQHKTLLQAELESRILHGLSCEWEAALWTLEESHRQCMKKPLFSLGNSSSRLGYWAPNRNEICISRDFVLNHPWDAVREVLLHEMAHQMAYLVFHSEDEKPHGPSFQKACSCLRAEPKASGRYNALDEKVFNSINSHNDGRLLRIIKLLALAESQNPHEAEAAMVKAHELIEKYNIDILELNKRRSFYSVFLGKPQLRHTRDRYHLARLLCDFYFVDGIWVSAYVLEKRKMGRVLEITGTIANIRIAAYVYDFVLHYINTQWETYNSKNTLNHHRKTDYAVGIVEGFISKLKKHRDGDRVKNSEKSLIKIEDPLLTQYMNYRYPHITKIYRNAESQDEGILRDGLKAGEAMVISKGISQKNSHSEILKIER